MEFLIKPTDEEWFGFHQSRNNEILRPSSFPSEATEGWGDHRIRVLDAEISFSFEDPGIQVCFESGTIPTETACKIVDEICENIRRVTGEQGRVVFLGE